MKKKESRNRNLDKKIFCSGWKYKKIIFWSKNYFQKKLNRKRGIDL